MTSKASSPEQYVKELPPERKEPVNLLREAIIKNLPKGFAEQMSYGMIGYVVPHSIYPNGYHCDPKLPLPFVSIASQKNYIAFYHMGMYAMPELLKWFQEEYPRYTTARLDMGKSCIRFKNPEHIPFKLISELMKKVSVKDWVATYEKAFTRK